MSADPTNITGGERMFAHRRRPFKGLLTLVSAFALIAFAGCDTDGGSITITGTDSRLEQADPDDLAVIEDWSQTLRSGDVPAAADYFAIPSVVQNGGPPVTIGSRADAVAFNKSLPCGARVVSARTTGELTRVTFRLSDRPGGDCGSGIGERASTLFDVEDGRIVEWRRIDSAPRTPAGEPEGSLT